MKEHLKVISSQVTGNSININLIFKSSSPHPVLIRGQKLHILHPLRVEDELTRGRRSYRNRTEGIGVKGEVEVKNKQRRRRWRQLHRTTGGKHLKSQRRKIKNCLGNNTAGRQENKKKMPWKNWDGRWKCEEIGEDDEERFHRRIWGNMGDGGG